MGCCAAFSIETTEEEDLVIAAEVRQRRQGVRPNADDAVDHGSLDALIRQAVAEVHGLHIHALTFLAPGTIPKTSSGKHFSGKPARRIFLPVCSTSESDQFPMATKRMSSRGLRPHSTPGADSVEPIAIIGMACRFPRANSPEEFWALLRDGVDAVSEVPPDRWDADQFYSSMPNTPRKMVTRWGGFLDNIDQFDASFFRISPREAERMDPQQRFMLEVTWEALEDAGLPPKGLAGSSTGVFIGLSSSDYSRLRSDLNACDPYMPTGNAASIAANRISFFFDLRGPSFVVDTACSSALVALHQACCSLWAGEFDARLGWWRERHPLADQHDQLQPRRHDVARRPVQGL